MTTAQMTAQPALTAINVNNGKFVGLSYSIAKGALILLCALMMLSALHPAVRSSLRSTFIKDFRTVLSTVQADIAGNGKAYTIAKIKTQDGLSIEIYEPMNDGTQKLVEKLQLNDKRDGFFNFNGQASNLAIDDIDGDGRLEILTPSFDSNLVGRLNVYRYQADANTLEQVLQ